MHSIKTIPGFVAQGPGNDRREVLVAQNLCARHVREVVVSVSWRYVYVRESRKLLFSLALSLSQLSLCEGAPLLCSL